VSSADQLFADLRAVLAHDANLYRPTAEFRVTKGQYETLWRAAKVVTGRAWDVDEPPANPDPFTIFGVPARIVDDPTEATVLEYAHG
jgi:hypothetical protein